jgi:hypothetical protein
VSRRVRGSWQADWLSRQPQARKRRWALEEQLFGPAALQDTPSAAYAPPPPRVIESPCGDVHSDENYLLSHCHDFTVIDQHGETGYVSDVRFLSRTDRPDELEITSTGHRPRSAWIPLSQVEHLSPDGKEITLTGELPWSDRPRFARQLLNRARATLHSS